MNDERLGLLRMKARLVAAKLLPELPEEEAAELESLEAERASALREREREFESRLRRSVSGSIGYGP